MPAVKRLMAFPPLALGLVVVLNLGGTIVMSDSTAADESAQPPSNSGQEKTPESPKQPEKIATATFGNGCFWCTEAVFQRLKGVKSVVSGYSGGTVKNPTYRQVCTGATGHAEAIQITFDPKEISFDDLLAVFWYSHDPTTKDRQGPDIGTQYRSVIFYHSDEQKLMAEKYKKKLDESGVYSSPIVTEIVPFTEFFAGEDYHQNYYNQHGQQPYCRAMIGPKLEKLKKAFKDKLKTEEKHS